MAAAKFTADGADPSWFPRVLRVLARDYPEINDKVWSTAIGENADEQVAKRKHADDAASAFGRSIAAKARWVTAHEGDLWPAWSTGETLAVALVLDDPAMIKAEGFTREQAISRLAGDIAGTTADAEQWVAEIQGAL